ncbi:MAG: hypothetical protein E6G41_18765 [Actinobacteria bacterium]|nr:MAG: hypothetical protein E6G41_18765 [Actinomycetota bacterium]
MTIAVQSLERRRDVRERGHLGWRLAAGSVEQAAERPEVARERVRHRELHCPLENGQSVAGIQQRPVEIEQDERHGAGCTRRRSFQRFTR